MTDIDLSLTISKKSLMHFINRALPNDVIGFIFTEKIDFDIETHLPKNYQLWSL